MQYTYDGQIRRYVYQLIRMLSGFKYQTGDGKQYSVPAMYGDMSRQAASVIRDNSENKVLSTPRISVYISGLSRDRDRMLDPYAISKINIREKEKLYDDSGNFIGYSSSQGNDYTIERLMPTPYKMTVKADIWSTNTDQKLQIMEQIMTFFNPSVEIQTTDNYLDWTSLTVVVLTDISFEERSIPAGIVSEINIGSMTFDTPIWINPPAKVKRLNAIQEVIMNIHDESYSFDREVATDIGGFQVFVYADQGTNQYTVEFLKPTVIIQDLALDNPSNSAFNQIGQDTNWNVLIDMYPGKFKAGYSQIFLTQPDGNNIVGTVSVNPSNNNQLLITLDQDTYPANTSIVGPAITRGTIDAIINPDTYVKISLPNGIRYMILKPIVEVDNNWTTSERTWPTNFTANANDIIEWDNNTQTWSVVFNSNSSTGITYTTNIKTGVQYKFSNNEWTKAFEGVYDVGYWRLVF